VNRGVVVLAHNGALLCWALALDEKHIDHNERGRAHDPERDDSSRHKQVVVPEYQPERGEDRYELD